MGLDEEMRCELGLDDDMRSGLGMEHDVTRSKASSPQHGYIGSDRVVCTQDRCTAPGSECSLE